MDDRHFSYIIQLRKKNPGVWCLLRASPEVLCMWCGKVKLDEKNPNSVGLAPHTVSRFTLAGVVLKKEPWRSFPVFEGAAESGRERATSAFFVRRRVLGDALWDYRSRASHAMENGFLIRRSQGNWFNFLSFRFATSEEQRHTLGSIISVSG